MLSLTKDLDPGPFITLRPTVSEPFVRVARGRLISRRGLGALQPARQKSSTTLAKPVMTNQRRDSGSSGRFVWCPRAGTIAISCVRTDAASQPLLRPQESQRLSKAMISSTHCRRGPAKTRQSILCSSSALAVHRVVIHRQRAQRRRSASGRPKSALLCERSRSGFIISPAEPRRLLPRGFAFTSATFASCAQMAESSSKRSAEHMRCASAT